MARSRRSADLRVVRASAVKARTQTINQIKSLIITAPAAVRAALRSLTTTELVRRLAASRPGADLADPATAVKLALKRLARRYRHLSEEIAEADGDLRVLIARTAPGLLAMQGVGTETAGQLLITAGDNPDRLASEASFAHLCAAAPCQLLPGAPTVTDSTVAETARPTARCTQSCWFACATTRAPATTWHDAPKKDSRRRTSSDVSSVSSHARSTTTSPAHSAGHPGCLPQLDDL